MSKNKSLLTMLTEQLDKKPSKPKAPKQQLMDESNPFYIAKSDIAGKGAFASQYIPKGSMVDMLHQINQPGQDYDFTQLGRNYNHSDAPNTKNKLVGNKRFMVATEDIMPGQELTGDYRMQPDLEQPQPNWNTQEDYPKMANGGYTVTRSSDRKGKTHKVTGPGGKVKYFGDSSMGQHPKDPERKAAFYARHKKNLDGNPFFRAFARATWKDGGQTLGSGLLAKSVNCKSCGHSWKSTDGGEDPLTCHNCGYVNDHMQQGGQTNYWMTDRSKWVDSVNAANMDKNFVQRMYQKNGPQMYLPGDKRPSTHFMESGDSRAYPTVVQRPGNKFVEWMNQNNPDGAMNYALDSGQYIQFPNDEQATWYGQNGYKTGKGVVIGKKDGGSTYSGNQWFQQGGEAAARRARINAANKAQANQFRSAEDFAKATSAIADKLRFSDEPNWFDDSALNPISYFGNMASDLGRVPLNIKKGNYGQAARDIATPVAAGYGERIASGIANIAWDYIPQSRAKDLATAAYHYIGDTRKINQIKKAHKKAPQYFKNPEVVKRLNEQNIQANMLELPSLTFKRTPTEIGSHYNHRLNNVEIDLPQMRDMKGWGYDQSALGTYDHEMGHWLQRELGETYNRRDQMNILMDTGEIYQPSPWVVRTPIDTELSTMTSSGNNTFYHPKANPKLAKGNQDYFLYGLGDRISQSNEPFAFLREMRTDMVKKGYLDNVLDTPAKTTIWDYMQDNPKNRIASFMGADPAAPAKLAELMGKLPSAAPVVGAGVAASQLMDQKRNGGQSRDEREMVNGIADILSQVQDPQNRAQIAANMMQDFKREKVTYNPDKFMQMSKLQNGGGWLDNYQEGGETDEAPAEYTGSSIVDYLQTKGFSGSKKFRKQLAEEMGVEGYNYSAKKNLELLNRLREEEELPEGYQPEFTPVPVDKIVQMERDRGVYAPMPEQVAPQPRVVSAPVSNKFRIPMAGAPANPYAGMFDPRVALNNIPVSKAKPAAPAAKKPVASAPVNHYGIPMAPQQIPGLWNQQAAMERIKNYVPVPQPKRVNAAPVRKAVVKPVTKAKVAAQETEDESIFSGMFSGYNPTGMGPIMGSTMSPAAYEAVADDIQGLWDKASSWFERNTAMGDGTKERKASIDPKKIANDPIYVTGDTIPDKNGRYHIPEVMDLNYLKFGTRNRGDYTPIDTEAGSITAFKPFESAKDYFAKNNDPANSTYMGVGPDGKIKVGGRKDFEGQDFKISKTFSNKIVDFNRNPDGSIVKVKSNPKASKETFSPSVKVMGEDGKIVDGKMSLLLPKSGNQEESFDLVTGGRYIMQTPDGKFKMVSGSLKNIEAEFKKMKKDNPYVNVITLDNGSYSRGIRTYDKNLSAKDLKKYDNQNTEGGNFAYLLPNAPKTRYDLKFNEFETTAKQRLQQLYPGKKVEVKFENEGLYDERGSRDITSQADIQKKGYSQTPVSMHNFDAARDYALFVDGKKIPADKQKDIYKKVLWGAADKVGMYHLDDWDAVHIGLVKEGEKTGFNELYAKYPDIFATANTKKTKAFLEKNKNNPVYKEAYELLNNIKPFVPKTPKKQDGGNWLEKYN